MDHAHHYNMAGRALEEVLVLAEAVTAALKMTQAKETLLVLTADHSHTLVFGGAAVPRGSPILGVCGPTLTPASSCLVDTQLLLTPSLPLPLASPPTLRLTSPPLLQLIFPAHVTVTYLTPHFQ